MTTAAAILGHDPAVFLRVYSHLYPDDLRAAAAVLDAAHENETVSACGVDVVHAVQAENPVDLQRLDLHFLLSG